MEMIATQEQYLGAYQLLAKCPDPSMQQVVTLVKQCAARDITVMIEGESGTGKELAASAIHGLSSRNEHRLEVVNCANQNPHLVGSELFGHAKGAFTGASQAHVGSFEKAHGGTVFLDEVGELSLELQPRLLRVLEDHSFTRVGGTEVFRTDFRVVAATNCDLKKMVKERTFREDLYFRLNVFPIVIPPLRKRPRDIMHFAKYFVSMFSTGTERNIKIAPESEQMLVAHVWPGNVRELKNVIERAMICKNGETAIHPRHLVGIDTETSAYAPDTLAGQPNAAEEQLLAAVTALVGHKTYWEVVELVERTMIIQALRKCGGHVSNAARELRLSERTLRYIKKKNGIKKE